MLSSEKASLESVARVSQMQPGCKNCYVFYLDSLRDKDADVIVKSKFGFNLPLKKTRGGAFKIPSGGEIATCFTSDFFIKEADP